MIPEFKDQFLKLWTKYFNHAELPLAFYYTEAEEEVELVSAVPGHRCLIAELNKVRKGRTLRYDAQAIGCAGGKKYSGFSHKIRPDFEYFLSCGIPGKVEGERYKKSPQLVNQALNITPQFKAPKKYLIFKRWDCLKPLDVPEAVIFWATPDVLCGLFTLANFDQAEPNGGVITPFGAGCGSIIQYPYQENHSNQPRCVLGMFDPSARPWVEPNILTFAAPMNKFITMKDNMEESFLITPTWGKILKRINKTSA
jgi:hypothetical protein